MRTIPVLLVLALGCAGTSPAPGPTPKSSATDTIEAANEREAIAVLEGIPDRQGDPAEQVFPNVITLRGTTARQFINIMAADYSRALGVRCSHCHVDGDYTSDALRPKRAAREMAVMYRTINQQLRKMENLESKPADTRAITCMTCHQGKTKPR